MIGVLVIVVSLRLRSTRAHRFAAPMAPGRHQRLLQRCGHRLFGGLQRRKQGAVADRHRREREAGGEGRLQRVAERGRTGPHRQPKFTPGTPAPPGSAPAHRRRRKSPRCRPDRNAAAMVCKLRPGVGRGLAGLAAAAVGADRRDMRTGRQPPARPHALGFRSPGSSRPTPAPCRRRTPGAPKPGRTEPAHSSLPISIVQQHVRPLGIVRPAHQHDVALAGGNPRAGDANRVGAAGLLAHEGAGRTDHAMHDGDIAGQKIGKLRQEQGRAEVAQQVLVQERAWIGCLGVTGQDGGIDGVSHAPRRRRRRSCPCATAARCCPSPRRSPAPARRRKRRCAARLPSGAGRRAWGSACPAPAAPWDARRRVRNCWHPAPSGKILQRIPMGIDAGTEAGDNADPGDQGVALMRHAG